MTPYLCIATFQKSSIEVRTRVEARHILEAKEKAKKKVRNIFTEDENKHLGEVYIECRRMKE